MFERFMYVVPLWFLDVYIFYYSENCVVSKWFSYLIALCYITALYFAFKCHFIDFNEEHYRPNSACWHDNSALSTTDWKLIYWHPFYPFYPFNVQSGWPCYLVLKSIYHCYLHLLYLITYFYNLILLSALLTMQPFYIPLAYINTISLYF